MTYTSKSPIKINTTNVQEIREILAHFDDALVDHEARISAGGGGGGGGGDPVITPIYQFSAARRLETGTANPGEIYRADSSSGALSYDANGLTNASAMQTFLGGQTGYWGLIRNNASSYVNFFQSSAAAAIASAPLWNPFGLNGRPAMDFSSGRFLFDASAVQIASGNLTAQIVLKPGNTTADQALFFMRGATDSNQIVLSHNGANGQIGFLQNGTWRYSGTTPSNGVQVLSFIMSQDNGVTILVNGQVIADGITFTQTPIYDALRLGNTFGTVGPFTGLMSEFRLWQGAMSLYDVQELDGNAMQFYRIDTPGAIYRASANASDLILVRDVSTGVFNEVPASGLPGGGGGDQESIYASLGYFNVRDSAYAGGAVGNGATNDAAAIQAALDAAVTAGGGIVYFPRDTVGSNNTFVIDTQITKSTGQNVYFLGEPGVVIKKGNTLSTRIFDFGTGSSSTWPHSTTAADWNNLHFIDLTFEGKGRVNCKYMGTGGGDLYTATFVSTGVVTVSGDQTHIFRVNDMVRVSTAADSTVQDQIQCTAVTYDSGTGLTTITTSGTFDVAAERIRLTIDNSDNMISLKKVTNCSFTRCRFLNIGNGAVRPSLVSEGVLWYDFGDTPTFVSLVGTTATVTVPGDQTARYPVNGYVRLRQNTTDKGTGMVTASSYSAPDTTLTITIYSGTPDGTINDISRSFLDNGPFRGSLDFYGCYWENCAQPITTNDSGFYGIRLHPGNRLYRCGSIKLTSKSYTGRTQIRGVDFIECGIAIWLQSALEVDIEGCRFIDAPGVSTKEAILVHYNNEIIVRPNVRSINICRNAFINSGNIYVAGDPTLISYDLNVSSNTFIDNLTGRSSALIVVASGKWSGITTDDNTFRGNAATFGAVLVLITVDTADTHRESISACRNKIHDVTSATPLRINVNGTVNRNIRGASVSGNIISSQSSTGIDLRYIDDLVASGNRSLTGIQNFIATNFQLLGNNISTSNSLPAVLFSAGCTTGQLAGNILASSNAGTAPVSVSAGVVDLEMTRNTITGNNRGINLPAASTRPTARDNTIVLTATGGIAISMNAAVDSGVLWGNTITAPSGTGILIGATALAWTLGRNHLISGTHSINYTGAAAFDGIGVLSREIETPTNKTYTLIRKAPAPMRIKNLITKTSSGTITVALQIEGVSVGGLSAVAVTSTEATTAASSGYILRPGETLTAVTSANAAAADLILELEVDQSLGIF